MGVETEFKGPYAVRYKLPHEHRIQTEERDTWDGATHLIRQLLRSGRREIRVGFSRRRTTALKR